MMNFQEQIRECNNVDWDYLRESEVSITVKKRAGAMRMSKADKLAVIKKYQSRNLKDYSTKRISQRSLAGEYDVSLSYINTILHDETLLEIYLGTIQHDTELLDAYNMHNYKLSDQDKADIKARWENRHTIPVMQVELAKEYHVTPPLINRVIKEK